MRSRGGLVTPLCPAGHLPHTGGDRDAARALPQLRRHLIGWTLGSRFSPVAIAVFRANIQMHLGQSGWRSADLPPCGEMPGRTDWGNPPTSRRRA